jgi:hypothetical protein
METPKLVIAAAAAPAREGLEFAVTSARDARDERLLLEDEAGAAALVVLGPGEGEFVFGYGRARLQPVGDARGRAFVDALARWLGLELEGTDEAGAYPEASRLDARWVRLGRGRDPFGTEWDACKLFFHLGRGYAEVFLRLSRDRTRAQFVEKWSKYRTELVAIFERTLGGPRPRKIRPRPERLRGPKGERLLSFDGALEVAVPRGFRSSQRPEGHWRLSDPDEEMLFELSHLRLPPLAPGAPGVAERLGAIIDDSEYRAAAAPIAAFRRDGVEFAWSEYRFDALDTKRPCAPPRPARGRWLVGANAWVQTLVTGCWWEADAAVAEQAWNDVVQSLQLTERIVAPLPRGAEA